MKTADRSLYNKNYLIYIVSNVGASGSINVGRVSDTRLWCVVVSEMFHT